MKAAYEKKKIACVIEGLWEKQTVANYTVPRPHIINFIGGSNETQIA